MAPDSRASRARACTGCQSGSASPIANDQEACNANRLQISQIGANNAAYQQLSVETFGRWEDPRVPPTGRPRWEMANWSLAQWPLFPRVEHQRGLLNQQADSQRQALTALETRGA